MPNLYDKRSELLIFYLQRFIEILRKENSVTWKLLVKAVNNKKAYIGLDEVFLVLSASGGNQLKVKMEVIEKMENPNFYADSNVLKDIIAGRYILDKAIHDRKLYVRGLLEDLLKIHQLVLHALVNGNKEREYLKLWLDFETNWKSRDKPDCWKLENQSPKF